MKSVRQVLSVGADYPPHPPKPQLLCTFSAGSSQDCRCERKENRKKIREEKMPMPARKRPRALRKSSLTSKLARVSMKYVC
eukprot:1161517-Pelagomonas_calceolata.AAC.8